MSINLDKIIRTVYIVDINVIIQFRMCCLNIHYLRQSWWFISTHLKNMLVKLDHLPRDQGDNKNIFELPPRSLPFQDNHPSWPLAAAIPTQPTETNHQPPPCPLHPSISCRYILWYWTSSLKPPANWRLVGFANSLPCLFEVPCQEVKHSLWASPRGYKSIVLVDLSRMTPIEWGCASTL